MRLMVFLSRDLAFFCVYVYACVRNFNETDLIKAITDDRFFFFTRN